MFLEVGLNFWWVIEVGISRLDNKSLSVLIVDMTVERVIKHFEATILAASG